MAGIGVDDMKLTKNKNFKITGYTRNLLINN